MITITHFASPSMITIIPRLSDENRFCLPSRIMLVPIFKHARSKSSKSDFHILASPRNYSFGTSLWGD